jgi:pimeloyl-ACP methyl ester carboxylesterase
MARDARAVMLAAGTQSAHVLGASMGGMIAQELALLYPKCVQSLILACTSYSGLFARWPDARFGRWLLPSKSHRPGPDSRRGLTDLLYADCTPAERIDGDTEIISGCTFTKAGFFNQFGAILRWNAYFRLPRINAATLVIHGDQDRLIPIQNGRTVAKRIPGARFEVIRNAGHILMTDQPEACEKALAGFLNELRNAKSMIA